MQGRGGDIRGGGRGQRGAGGGGEYTRSRGGSDKGRVGGRGEGRSTPGITPPTIHMCLVREPGQEQRVATEFAARITARHDRLSSPLKKIAGVDYSTDAYAMLANQHPILPLANFGPSLAEFRRRRPNIGRIRPSLADSWPTLAEFGRRRPKLGRNLPVARSKSTWFGRFRAKELASVSRHRSKLNRVRGSSWPKSGPVFDLIRPVSTQTRQKFGQGPANVWAKSTKLRSACASRDVGASLRLWTNVAYSSRAHPLQQLQTRNPETVSASVFVCICVRSPHQCCPPLNTLEVPQEGRAPTSAETETLNESRRRARGADLLGARLDGAIALRGHKCPAARGNAKIRPSEDLAGEAARSAARGVSIAGAVLIMGLQGGQDGKATSATDERWVRWLDRVATDMSVAATGRRNDPMLPAG